MALVGYAFRIVWQGVQLAWVVLPVSDKERIIRTAQTYLLQWAQRLECDITGTPFIEIGEQIAATESPEDIAKAAITVITRIYDLDIPGLLWFRYTIGEKTKYAASYTTDIDKAKVCALRLFEQLSVLDDSAPNPPFLDSFEIGYRFTLPNKPGRSKHFFLTREVITDQTFPQRKTGKELDDDFKADEDPKDNECYGFFAVDYCVPPPVVEGPLELGPPPKMRNKCGRFQQVVFVGSRGNPPFQGNYVAIEEDPKFPQPNKLYYSFYAVDQRGNAYAYPGNPTYEVDWPIPAKRVFFTDNDRSIRYTLDDRKPGYERVYYIPARGVIKGTITEIYQRPEFLRADGIRPDRWGTRLFHFYESTVDANVINVDSAYLLCPVANPKEIVITARFGYDEVFPNYAFGPGKGVSMRLQECTGKTPKPPDEKPPCAKGWKRKGNCFVYDSCDEDGPGVGFELCAGMANDFPYVRGTVNFPPSPGDDKGGSLSITAGDDATVAYTDANGNTTVIVDLP